MGQEKTYYCIGCGKIHDRKDFYKSYNPDHKNGVYPFCKDYIKKEVYRRDKSIDIEKFKNLLMQMDAPFLIDEFEGAVEEKRETIGAYFSRISMVQNRGLTWKDSTSEDRNIKSKEDNEDCYEIEEDFIDDFKITPQMKYRWGNNYLNNEIRDLEKFYDDMCMTHSIFTPQHKVALIMMCKMQLKLNKFLEDNDMTSFSKLHKEYQSLLQSSGLRPIDKVGGDEATGMRSFSQIFEEVERDGFIKPASITENQDIVDRTIQYIMNYTLKLLNQQVLTEPPIDTPKGDNND